VISQVPASGPAGPAGGPPASQVRCGVVPPLADGFSPRPETAAGLAGALVPGAVVALVPARPASGSPDWLAPGGKTQLAVYAAESLWHARDVSVLLWITATSRAAVLAGYGQAAAAVLGPHAASDAGGMTSRFTAWLAETSQPWLVVLDDLAAPAELEGLWPDGPAGRVLVTAASQAALPAALRPVVLGVGGFSQREALSYLMGRLTADTDQRLGAIDLVADLGGEPLALAQASGVIASSALSCRDYRGYFVDRRAQLVKQLGRPPGSKPPAAAVTWMFSVEQAGRLAPGTGAQPVLALAALLDRHGIPGSVFGTPAAAAYLTATVPGPAPERDRARDALLTMERTGLLDIGPAGTPPLIRMTSAVQAAVRAALPARLQEQAARAAADALLQAWGTAEDPLWLAESLRCCTASLHQAAGHLLWSGGCHPVLLRAGQSLDAGRLTGPAVAYWQELAAVADQALGSGHRDTLAIGERLAEAYLAAGQVTEAITWFERVSADRSRLLGPDHPGTVAARRDLARALLRAGQPGAAVTVLSGAASDYERICGPGHPDTLATRDDLAAAYRAAGQLAEAIPLQRRTLADRERSQGPQHPDTMTSRQRLADTYLAGGRVKDAISQYKRVLADREGVLGPDHPDTIAARGNLGSAYHAAGRMASAVRLFEETRATYGRVLGPDHPDTLARCLSLASAYYAVGRLSDARTLLEATLAGCERTLPPGDPLTQAARDSLANIVGS
jgi:tetratricopeptide (TPR) repeat protein